MRDTSKQLRIAVFNCLNGNIGYNIYDEKRKVSATDSTFVLLSTQQETPGANQTDYTWWSRSSIDIEIIQKTGSETSKDTIDEISNTILSLLLPTTGTTGLTQPSNLQFVNAFCESIISRNISLSETESILTKIIRFVVEIVQQS